MDLGRRNFFVLKSGREEDGRLEGSGSPGSDGSEIFGQMHPLEDLGDQMAQASVCSRRSFLGWMATVAALGVSACNKAVESRPEGVKNGEPSMRTFIEGPKLVYASLLRESADFSDSSLKGYSGHVKDFEMAYRGESQNEYIPGKRSSLEISIVRIGRYIEGLKKILQENGVPECLLGMIIAESNCDPWAQSSYDASGPAQITPITADYLNLVRGGGTVSYRHRKVSHTYVGKNSEGSRQFKDGAFFVDREEEPYFNQSRNLFDAVKAMALYLKKLHGRFGDWGLAVLAYNCGPGTMRKRLKRIRPRKGESKLQAYLRYMEGKSENSGRAKENYDYLAKTLGAARALNWAIEVNPADKDFAQEEIVGVNYSLPLEENGAPQGKEYTIDEIRAHLGMDRGEFYFLNAGAGSPYMNILQSEGNYEMWYQVRQGDNWGRIARNLSPRPIEWKQVEKGLVLKPGTWIKVPLRMGRPKYDNTHYLSSGDRDRNAALQPPLMEGWTVYVPKKHEARLKELLLKGRARTTLVTAQ